MKKNIMKIAIREIVGIIQLFFDYNGDGKME